MGVAIAKMLMKEGIAEVRKILIFSKGMNTFSVG